MSTKIVRADFTDQMEVPGVKDTRTQSVGAKRFPMVGIEEGERGITMRNGVAVTLVPWSQVRQVVYADVPLAEYLVSPAPAPVKAKGAA